MKLAVPRWRISVPASLKSITDRHGLPAIRPVTGTSSGHAPGRCATAADAMFKPLQLVTASACGLAVPPTLISNAPHAVRRFAAELHTTTLDPHTPWDSLLVWFLASFALGLGIEHGYTGADTTKPPTASWIVTGDGSWAEVTLAQADGQYSVVEGGPRHIWRILENTRDLWADLGQPCWERFGLTVTPDRQTVWLDRPDGDHIWSLGS